MLSLLCAFSLLLAPQSAFAQMQEEPSEGALSDWLPRAQKGDAQAEYLVGNAYFNGRGAPRDFKAAANWLNKAAVQGHTKGMVLMGLLNSGGRGVPLDSIEALKWY